jgi:hypothetical protein
VPPVAAALSLEEVLPGVSGAALGHPVEPLGQAAKHMRLLFGSPRRGSTAEVRYME